MRSCFHLTKEDLAQVHTLIHSNPKGHQLNRLRFLEYKHQGKTNREIGALLGKCRKTLTNWTNQFAQEGLEAFVFIDYNRRTSKLAVLTDDIRKEVRTNGFSSLAAFVAWAKGKGVQTSLSNAHYFIKKNSIALSKSSD